MLEKEITNVTIYKKDIPVSFEKGANLIIGEEETKIKVQKITVDIFNNVRVYLSDNKIFHYRNVGISFSEEL